MNNQTIDRPELAKLNDKVILLMGKANDKTIRGGEFQLLTECKVNDVQFRTANAGISINVSSLDHVFMPIKSKHKTDKYICELVKVCEYTRSNGTRAYGVTAISNPIDHLVAEAKSIGFLIHQLARNIELKLSSKDEILKYKRNLVHVISLFKEELSKPINKMIIDAVNRKWFETLMEYVDLILDSSDFLGVKTKSRRRSHLQLIKSL